MPLWVKCLIAALLLYGLGVAFVELETRLGQSLVLLHVPFSEKVVRVPSVIRR
jgi:hypothetical protein